MPKKGDIILIQFPFTDLMGEKFRPAFVVSAPTNHTIALFITSSHKNGKWNISIKATKKTGLHVPSFIVCDKIASFDTRIVQGLIGVAPIETIKKVDLKIKHLLHL